MAFRECDDGVECGVAGEADSVYRRFEVAERESANLDGACGQGRANAAGRTYLQECGEKRKTQRADCQGESRIEDAQELGQTG